MYVLLHRKSENITLTLSKGCFFPYIKIYPKKLNLSVFFTTMTSNNVDLCQCVYEPCSKEATHALRGATRAMFCRHHAKVGHMPVGKTEPDVCEDSECKRKATLNWHGSSTGRSIFCQDHAPAYFDPSDEHFARNCRVNGCRRRVRVALDGSAFGTLIFCRAHAGREMKHYCVEDGCGRLALSNTNYSRCDEHDIAHWHSLCSSFEGMEHALDLRPEFTLATPRSPIHVPRYDTPLYRSPPSSS